MPSCTTLTFFQVWFVQGVAKSSTRPTCIAGAPGAHSTLVALMVKLVGVVSVMPNWRLRSVGAWSGLAPACQRNTT